MVEEPGTVLVSGRLLADITRALPARPVDGDHRRRQGAAASAARSTFSLPTLPVEDYPTLPEMPAQTGSLSGASFAAAVAPGRRRGRP